MEGQAILKEFTDLIESTVKETGKELAESVQAVAQYAASRAAHLAKIGPSDPDFMDAVIAERNNVALRAGISATNSGDAVDAKILGVIHGALALGAKALAVIA